MPAAPECQPPVVGGRVVSIRIPPQIEQRLEALAVRDANSVSAVVRRLLATALREFEPESSRG